MANNDHNEQVNVAGAAPDKNSVSKKKPWIFFILALIYTFSPIDFIPDTPLLGWVDDMFALSAASLNLLEAYSGTKYKYLFLFLRYAKWILLGLGIFIVIIFGLAAWGILSWLF